MKRSGYITRKTPLARSRKPIRKVGAKRAKEKRSYKDVRAEYIAAHPYCQISIALHGLDETAVIEFQGLYKTATGLWSRVPYATQIHHRNKSHGARLTDTRWFLAVCWSHHCYVEGNKSWARLHGFLLPLNADADGKTPDGSRALETPAFMASKVT